MTSAHIKNVGFAILFFSILLAVGCHHPPVPPPPPPAATNIVTPTPPPPAPTITLRAQPATIDRGGSTTLQWERAMRQRWQSRPESAMFPLRAIVR